MKRAVFIFLAVVAALTPFWPYSQNWGFAPSLGFSMLVMILLALRICRSI